MRPVWVAVGVLVGILVLFGSPTAAQDGMTATVEPAAGPAGSTFTISGAVPASCGRAVVHRSSEPAVGQGQTPVADGRHSVTFGVPERVGPGQIEVEVYCLEDPDLRTTVVFTVTAPDPSSSELAETGRASWPLAAGAVSLIVTGVGLVVTSRTRRSFRSEPR